MAAQPAYCSAHHAARGLRAPAAPGRYAGRCRRGGTAVGGGRGSQRHQRPSEFQTATAIGQCCLLLSALAVFHANQAHLASGRWFPGSVRSSRLSHTCLRSLAPSFQSVPHSSQGKTALHLAAIWGHSRAIRTLLAGGAAPTLPDSEGDLPLHSATLGSQLAAVRLLLDAAPHTAASVNQRGEAPLLLAVSGNSTATVRLLLKAAPQAVLFKRR